MAGNTSHSGAGLKGLPPGPGKDGAGHRANGLSRAQEAAIRALGRV